MLKHVNKREFIDGKTVGRPSSIKGASYTSVLRSPAGSPVKNSFAVEGKGKILVRDKGCQVKLGEVEGKHHVVQGGMATSVKCLIVREVDGVLWAIKAQLAGVIEYVRDFMINVDKGLDLVIDLGGGLITNEGGQG